MGTDYSVPSRKLMISRLSVGVGRAVYPHFPSPFEDAKWNFKNDFPMASTKRKCSPEGEHFDFPVFRQGMYMG